MKTPPSHFPRRDINNKVLVTTLHRMGFKRINSNTTPGRSSQQTIDSLWKKPNHSRTPPKMHQQQKIGGNLIADDAYNSPSTSLAIEVSSQCDKKLVAMPTHDHADQSSHSSTTKKLKISACRLMTRQAPLNNNIGHHQP